MPGGRTFDEEICRVTGIWEILKNLPGVAGRGMVTFGIDWNIDITLKVISKLKYFVDLFSVPFYLHVQRGTWGEWSISKRK